MDRTIYLIGFMGSGKSHVGKKLAAALYCPFLDLDQAIERRSGLKVREIFEQKGEAYFRLLERRALHDTAFGPPRIVATGGGTPCFFDNMAWINHNGLAIYLNAHPSVLLERLWRGRAKRPLIAHLGEANLLPFIKKKIGDREAFYKKAPVHYSITSAAQNTAEDLLISLDQITGH